MFTFTLKRLKKNENGIALMGVLFIFCIAGIIAVTTFITTSHENETVEANLRYNQSLYTTESAISNISLSLRNINNWDDTVWAAKIGNPISTVGGSAVLDNITFDLTNFISDFMVTGTASGSEPRQVVVKMYGTLSPFDHAACSCSSLDISSAAIDSYDSDLGPYGGTNLGCQGDVGSNKNISVGNSVVCGDVEGGADMYGNPGANVSGVAELGGNALNFSGTVVGGITEGISPPPEPCKCGLDVGTPLAAAKISNDNGSIDPAFMTTATDFAISGKKNVVLGCGDYYFTSFTIGGAASVTVDPSCTDANPIRIYLDGAGPFDFGGNGIINAPERSTNLRIYSLTTTTISFHGSNEFAGLVYTPNAHIDVSVGGGGFYGAYVADTSYMAGGVDLHYDTQMSKIIDLQDGFARLKRLSWKENTL